MACRLRVLRGRCRSRAFNTGARSVMASRHRSIKQSSRRISNDERHHATNADMATNPVFADLPLSVRGSTGRSAWDTGQTNHAQNGTARAGRRDAWTNPALLHSATKHVAAPGRAVHALASGGHDRGAARNACPHQCPRRRTFRAVQFDHRGNRRAVSRCARQQEAECVNRRPTSYRGIAVMLSHRGPCRRGESAAAPGRMASRWDRTGRCRP